MTELREVGVMDMLCARDERADRQQRLLAAHGLPILSFTMNIAGPIKTDALIKRAFMLGAARIEAALKAHGAQIRERIETFAFTGCELALSVDAPAEDLKRWMRAIEERDALGRLFDIDILDARGRKLARDAHRRCLICGADAHACARSRAHEARELYLRAREIMQAHFDEVHARRIGMCAQQALLYEAITTPKPGLVDREDSGAHGDMDLFSFAASAAALGDWFAESARIGASMRGEREAEIFARLRAEGYWAEERMLSATGGVNTHKGALFSLGILCCAAGMTGEDASMDDLLTAAARLAEPSMEDLRGLDPGHARTGGEAQYVETGRTGVRGEAAAGFPHVRSRGLPALTRALSEGKNLNDAGLAALIALMASLDDSNILRRGGMDALRRAQNRARELERSGFGPEDLRSLNREFIRENVSPGGSADLLAVTYFLYFMHNATGGTQP